MEKKRAQAGWDARELYNSSSFQVEGEVMFIQWFDDPERDISRQERATWAERVNAGGAKGKKGSRRAQFRSWKWRISSERAHASMGYFLPAASPESMSQSVVIVLLERTSERLLSHRIKKTIVHFYTHSHPSL